MIKSIDSVEFEIHQAIATVTGHQVADLDNELFLEGDLGLDSIKLVSLMNILMKLIPEDQLEAFIKIHPMNNLMKNQTLGDIVKVFKDWSTSRHGQDGKEGNVTAAGISHSQYTFLASHWSIGTMTISSRFKIRGAFDSRTLWYAWTQLVDRHPLLKTRFLIPEDATSFQEYRQVVVDSPIPPQIPVADLSHISPPDQQNGIKEMVERYINEQFPLDVWPLHKMHAVKINEEVHEIILVNHHIVSDGLSNHQFIGELLEIYGALMAKRKPQLPSAMTIDAYNEVIEKLNSWNDSREKKNLKEYLHKQGKIKYFFNPDDRELQHPLALTKTLQFSLGKELTGKLISLTGVWKVSLFVLLVSTYVKMLKKLGETGNEIVINLPTGGRVYSGVDASGIIGCFAQNIAPTLSCQSADKDWESLVRDIDQEIKTCVQLGIDRALIRQSAEAVLEQITLRNGKMPDFAASFLRSALKSNVYLSFIGDTGIRKNYYDWEVIDYAAFTSTNAGTIDTLMEIFHDNLTISINYDSLFFDENFIDKIKEEFKATLATLLAYEIKPLEKRNFPPVSTTPAQVELTAELCRMAFDIFHKNITLGDIDKDLEADYGMDSLQRIRFIARLAPKLNGMSKDPLFECRTIREMVNVITAGTDERPKDTPMIEDKMNSRGGKAAGSREDTSTVSTRDLKAIIINSIAEITGHAAADLEPDMYLEGDIGIDSIKLVSLFNRLMKVIPASRHDRFMEKFQTQTLMRLQTVGDIMRLFNELLSGESDTAPVESSPRDEEYEIPYLQIAAQCRKTPKAVAIVHKDGVMTYEELHHQSNRIAHYLRKRGVGRGSFVGIMTYPGDSMLIGMIGIQKAGGAYVPIDPAYPFGRINYILGHAKVKTLITVHELERQIADCFKEGLFVDNLIFMDEGNPMSGVAEAIQVQREEWMESPASDPRYINEPDDIMNVLYTSGSTGNPKGVMSGHRGYQNRLVWHQKMFQLKPGERVAQKTSCCFDISVWELFWPLMYGGVVCALRREVVKNPWKLAKWLNDARINVMHFVPSMFGEFINALEGETVAFPELRWLIFSGEALPLSFMQKWIDKHGFHTGLANLYGPTEASIDVTWYIISERPGSKGEASIPIGKPVDNVHIRILDDDMKPVAKGEKGELWIGGIQLARGYYQNPEKTAEAFKKNIFTEIPGDYIYRTGDLVSELPDGNIEYHGRIDNQIKIRGFRVELGEIEAVLGTHPAIKEAAVVPVDYEDGKQLIAWLCGNQVGDKEVKDFISQRLADYMIPHRIEWLASLPKTPNGKLDRRALLTCDPGVGKRDESSSLKNGGSYDLPLGPAQRWMIKYFDAPYLWAGYTRFLYKQPLDMVCFNKAFDAAIARHAALRTVLVNKNQEWFQRVLAVDRADNIEYFDGTTLDDERRKDEIASLIRETVKNFQITQWPLWKVFVIKISDSLYDITVIGHHFISDMLSNTILFQDIWKLYSLLLKNEDTASLPVPCSYPDYVEMLTREEGKGNFDSQVQYWLSAFPSREYAYRFPFDHYLHANSESSSATMQFEANREETALIRGKAKKHYSANVYDLLLAPLYRLLSERSDQKQVVVSHRVHGRDMGEGRGFFESAGNFAVNFPLGIALSQEDSWREIITKVQKGLEGVPMKGIAYDMVADKLPSYLYPDHELTPFRANYLGVRDIPSSEVFEFFEEDMDQRFSLPEQKRTAVIEFFFSIKNGHIRLDIEYSKNLHGENTIQSLGSRYMQLLKELVAPLGEEKAPEHARHRTTASSAGPFYGKTVIVTGGGKGIGRSIAHAFARQGAQVALVGRTLKYLDQTKSELESVNGKVLSIPVDISDFEQVNEAVQRIAKHFGAIDVLVNNAGITQMRSLVDSNAVDWKKIIEVNLFGCYHMCRAVAPYLIKQKQGKIVNIGSDSSHIGYPLMSAYASSKHGILGLTRSLAEEMKPFNVQVNAVCPAMVDTDMAPKAFKGKIIFPEEIADIVLFLSSPSANSITGEDIRAFGKQDMFWYGSQHMKMMQGFLDN